MPSAQSIAVVIVRLPLDDGARFSTSLFRVLFSFWVTMEVGLGGGGQRVSRNHIANDDVHNERADSLLRGANRRNQTSTACAGIDLCLLAQTEPAEWDDETASASSAFRGVFMPTLLMNVRIHDMSY